MRAKRPSGATALDVLGDTEYMDLTTFRKDGTPVSTPVWVVRIGSELRVWTGADTGKYKRIRRNPAVTVTPCSMRGKPYGAPVPGTARLLGADEARATLEQIAAKYGIGGKVTIWRNRIAAKFRGEPVPAAGLGIVLDGPAPEAPSTTS